MAFGFDPTTSAFLRTMGVQEANIYAESRARTNIAQRGYARTIPIFAERSRAAQQGVKDDAETRGVYSSGATAIGVARARAGVQAEQSEARAQASDTGISYGLDAARRVAELRQRGLEASLAGRTSQATAAARARYGGYRG